MNSPEITSKSPNSGIFGWLDSPAVIQVVTKYGNIFKKKAVPSSVDEECHYLYYYGEIEHQLRKKFGMPYHLENCSHEKIATALCVLAACTKYLIWEKGRNSVLEKELERYLHWCPVELQIKKCQRFLDSMKICTAGGASGNPQHVSAKHLNTYEIVFNQICKFLQENEEDYFDVDFGVDEDLEEFKQSRGYHSCVWFLKGYFSLIGETRAHKCLESLQAAREIEPGYYFWWYASFLAERKINGINEQNCQALLEIARRAYLFSPESMKVRTGLALIISGLQNTRLSGGSYWTKQANRDLLERARLTLILDSLDPTPLQKKWACIKMSVMVRRCWCTKMFRRHKTDDYLGSL